VPIVDVNVPVVPPQDRVWGYGVLNKSQFPWLIPLTLDYMERGGSCTTAAFSEQEDGSVICGTCGYRKSQNIRLYSDIATFDFSKIQFYCKWTPRISSNYYCNFYPGVYLCDNASLWKQQYVFTTDHTYASSKQVSPGTVYYSRAYYDSSISKLRTITCTGGYDDDGGTSFYNQVSKDTKSVDEIQNVVPYFGASDNYQETSSLYQIYEMVIKKI